MNWWDYVGQKVRGQGHCDLTKHILLFNLRMYIVVMTMFKEICPIFSNVAQEQQLDWCVEAVIPVWNQVREKEV